MMLEGSSYHYSGWSTLWVIKHTAGGCGGWIFHTMHVKSCWVCPRVLSWATFVLNLIFPKNICSYIVNFDFFLIISLNISGLHVTWQKIRNWLLANHNWLINWYLTLFCSKWWSHDLPINWDNGDNWSPCMTVINQVII